MRGGLGSARNRERERRFGHLRDSVSRVSVTVAEQRAPAQPGTPGSWERSGGRSPNNIRLPYVGIIQGVFSRLNRLVRGSRAS